MQTTKEQREKLALAFLNERIKSEAPAGPLRYIALKPQVMASVAKVMDAYLTKTHNYRLLDAQQQLLYLWETTGSCPCGARRESPNTHSHVAGCPTAMAVVAKAALEGKSDG